MKTTSYWRMFCAVELPDEVRAQLQDHIARLRAEIPDVAASWSRVENIHLTVKFFGNVAVDRIGTISTEVERAVKGISPFEITIGGVGVFPRVLWIGVSEPSGKLAALHERLGKEDRAFRPHLTIARIRRPGGAKRLANAHLQMEFKPIPLTLNNLALFRSELSPKGSKYTVISSHRLDG